eukprot:CAMPEP_0175347170 /NCGR_PEP_ID=MMETSP0095-20121207/9244_1 /TAXON_ID=311494 /ORGANISM="Alexandrium monilatum, Strain CCMP3105" /LENGTH=420 /DNA_ID=CAMNT_0016644659 /DNA_START=59 /DNA_END=1321 /DNA_ORIENTATION=+
MAARRLSFLVFAISPCTARAAGLSSATRDDAYLLQQAVSVREADLAVHTPAQAAPCSKMGYFDNRFPVDMGLTGLESQTFTFQTACDYYVDLTGWTETAFCHEGFARNISGSATAVVRGLKPGTSYDFKIWQIAYSYEGDNPLAVNGVPFGNTLTTKDSEPSATGAATASSTGRITFTFTHTSPHVSISGLAISEAPRLPLPSAVDDPHLVNIRGERFDVLRPRNHTLLQIPRGAATADTLLRIDAAMRNFEADCTELYIRTLHVTGRWADEATGGPLTFHAGGDGLGRLGISGIRLGTGGVRALTKIRSAPPRGVKWIQDGPREKGIISRVSASFGPTRAVIDWRQKQRKGVSIDYLNLRVLRLGQTNESIGGLLGLDDHSFAASMPEECQATPAASSVFSESSEEIPLQAAAMAEASL